MGIKRNEPFIELQLEPRINKENMFSYPSWKRAINWDLILAQIKKTENACLLIDANLYRSRLFPIYIDIMEANLYILDDIFYHQTGIRVGYNYDSSSYEDKENLKFWNMDYYQKIKLSIEGIDRIVIHLMNLSKDIPLFNISHLVIDSVQWDLKNKETKQPALESYDIFKEPSFNNAYEAYWDSIEDEKALQDQYRRILDFLDNYRSLFCCLIKLSVRDCDFEELLKSFRKGIKGRKFIQPWRRDFLGSRDSLIVKMEKDPVLGPWVNRYTHRREDKSIIENMFYDDNWHIRNEEEIYNSDNWIRVLTIAAVLQEYDEQQDVTADVLQEYDEQQDVTAITADKSDEDETLLTKLSLYFKDEDAAKRFLNKVRLLKGREIINMVQKNYDNKLCTTISKDLWQVLHDANIYKLGYSNWNAQLKKKKG